jgi:hypothetical protein
VPVKFILEPLLGGSFSKAIKIFPGLAMGKFGEGASGRNGDSGLRIMAVDFPWLWESPFDGVFLLPLQGGPWGKELPLGPPWGPLRGRSPKGSKGSRKRPPGLKLQGNLEGVVKLE